jgi:hypothetical protein
LFAQPEVAEVSENTSNVGLHVTSTLEERVRLTVRFDGKLAWTLQCQALGAGMGLFTGTPTDCLGAKRQ